MKIGILGTGIVGRVIGAKLVELGHDIALGTRDVNATLARTTPDGMGSPPFAVWHKDNAQVKLLTLAGAAAHGEIIFNCTSGGATVEALHLAQAANLAGKLLIDLSNPLDFSKGMPPTLTVCNTDSVGEQIQRAFPHVKVVKTLNTVTASLMVNPGQIGGGDHDVFVSGNEAGAKAQTIDILRGWFGWKNVIDLGDITTARGTEMYLPIWLRLWGALGTGLFNVKIIK